MDNMTFDRNEVKNVQLLTHLSVYVEFCGCPKNLNQRQRSHQTKVPLLKVRQRQEDKMVVNIISQATSCFTVNCNFLATTNNPDEDLFSEVDDQTILFRLKLLKKITSFKTTPAIIELVKSTPVEGITLIVLFATEKRNSNEKAEVLTQLTNSENLWSWSKALDVIDCLHICKHSEECELFTYYPQTWSL
jgi:hypothetical protein